MKLYLASKHVQFPAELVSLVGKDPSTVKARLIVNAFDNYPEDKRLTHITGLTESLKKTKFQLEGLDLREYTDKPDQLHSILSDTDLLWISGGNVFYLRYILKTSGLDKILPELLNKGLVYGGDSAGAAVLGGDMHGLDLLDDPSQAKEVIFEGLNITPFIVLPHWGNERYKNEIAHTKTILERHNQEIVTINDEQVCVVDGKSRRVLG
jgi:dipeptidase E